MYFTAKSKEREDFFEKFAEQIFRSLCDLRSLKRKEFALGKFTKT